MYLPNFKAKYILTLNETGPPNKKHFTEILDFF